MRTDFAIFIVTHGRPHEQKTYQYLLEAGYTGKVYFVIDDLDETADEYKRLYGENVLVFDKEAEYGRTLLRTRKSSPPPYMPATPVLTSRVSSD